MIETIKLGPQEKKKKKKIELSLSGPIYAFLCLYFVSMMICSEILLYKQCSVVSNTYTFVVYQNVLLDSPTILTEHCKNWGVNMTPAGVNR